MIAKAIFSLLKDATITAIATSGIHRLKAPQGTGFPQVVFTIDDDNQEYHMSGADRLRGVNLDIRCRANIAEEIDQLKTAVYNKLSAFNGDVNGIQIQLITFQGSGEGNENASDGSEEIVKVVSMDFDVTYFGN